MALLALGLAATGAGADIEVSGRLVTSRPLPPGALVRLVPWESPWERPAAAPRAALPSTSVEADGSFRLSAPRAGMWQLLAEGRGLVPLRLPLLPLTEPLELATAPWPEAGECSLQARDQPGHAVAGAEIRATPLEEPEAPPTPEPRWEIAPVSGTTDEAGRFRFPCPPNLPLRVELKAQGHAPRSVEVRAGRETPVRMTPGQTFNLEVQIRKGQPAPRVTVWLEGFSLPLGTTSDAGLLDVHTLPDGRPRLRLLAADGRAEAALTLPPTPPPRLTVTLQPVPSLQGRARAFSDGRPLPGVFVWAGRRASSWAETDSSGAYSLPLPVELPRFVYAGGAGFFTEYWELPAPPVRPGEVGPAIALHAASTLAGRVEDGDQNPLGAVEIRARLVPGGLGTLPLAQRLAGSGTRSGPRGNFRLGKLAPGRHYEVRFAKPGFAPQVLRLRSPPEGESAAAARVVLENGLTLRGEIVDAEGRPVAGARITLGPAAARAPAERMAQLRDPDSALLLETSSDLAGRFELLHAGPGRYDLRARAAGFAALVKRGLVLPADHRELNLGRLLLEPEGRVEGLVTDDSGQPVAGAEIRLLASDELQDLAELGADGQAPADATTDPSGRFVLLGQRHGDRLKLRATASGFAAAEHWGVQVPTDQPVILRLKPLCFVRGRVVDSQGRPLAAAWVSAEQPKTRVVVGMVASQPNWRQTTSDETGVFHFEELAAGRLELEARLSGYRHTQRALTLECGKEPVETELVLNQGGALVGRVFSSSGEAVIGAAIGHYEPTEPGQVIYRAPLATSDGEGRYRLDGLATGPAQLVARHAAFGEVVASVEVVPGEQEHDFRFEPGRTLRGEVVDDIDQPVHGARVVLRAAGRALGLPAALADAAGGFTFEGLAPGSYSLLALASGGPRSEQAVEVEVGDTDPDPVLLRLNRPGSVAGRILGLSEQELSRVLVFWMSELEALGEVAGDGSYRIEGVPAGRVGLTARLAGTGRYAEGSVEVEPGGEASLDLDFGSGFLLSGRIVLDGVPLARAAITAQLQGADERRTSSGDDGQFRFEGLAAGRWLLAVRDAEGELLWQGEATLERDRTLTIQGQTTTVEGQVTDQASGEPIAGASVRLLWGSGPWRGQTLRQTSTDSGGSFYFSRVLMGDWWVGVSTAQGHNPALEPAGPGTSLHFHLLREN